MQQQILDEAKKSTNPSVKNLLHLYETCSSAEVKLACEKRLEDYFEKGDTRELKKSKMDLPNGWLSYYKYRFKPSFRQWVPFPFDSLSFFL